jgi:hypothetical protein
MKGLDKMKLRFAVILLMLCTAFSVFISCNQDEGFGGSSSVEGYVYNVIHYNDNYSFMTDTVPALGKKVYISFGDDMSVGDNTDAGSDGYYRFDYLRKGSYRIYAYSETDRGIKSPESRTVIVGSGTTQVPAIYIHSGKTYGTSLIRGYVNVTYYHNGIKQDNGVGTGVRAYIRHAGEDAYFDDIRVADGIFVFQKVYPGSYEIAVETQDRWTEKTTLIIQSITVDKTGIIYDLPEIFEVNKSV